MEEDNIAVTTKGLVDSAWDYEFYPKAELKPLENIDLGQYGELVDEYGGERRLNIALPSGETTILLRAYEGEVTIENILDQLPTVKVYRDDGQREVGNNV